MTLSSRGHESVCLARKACLIIRSTIQCEWQKMWNLFCTFDIWICFKWTSKEATHYLTVQKISYGMKIYPVGAECNRSRLHSTSALPHIVTSFFACWKCIKRWHLILCTRVDCSQQSTGKVLKFTVIHVTRQLAIALVHIVPLLKGKELNPRITSGGSCAVQAFKHTLKHAKAHMQCSFFITVWLIASIIFRIICSLSAQRHTVSH